MRWPWSKPKRPEIPPFRPPPPYPPVIENGPKLEQGPVEVKRQHAPDPGIEVEEVDTRSMTETGIFKAWKRMTGRE